MLSSPIVITEETANLQPSVRLSVSTATQWAHDCGIMCRGSFANNRGVLVEVGGGGVFEHLAPNVFAPSRHLQVQLGFICTNRVAVTCIQRLLKLIISLLGLCLGFRLRVLVLVRVTVRLEKCYG